jgi:hypothetical protein
MPDGMLLVYAIASQDPGHARAVAAASTREVDADHHRVLGECLMPGRVDQTVLELRPAARPGTGTPGLP